MIKEFGLRVERWRQSFPNPQRDFFTTAFLVGSAAVLSFLLHDGEAPGNHPALIFVLSVALVSRFTDGYFWGIFASLCGVVCVNYVFTFPYWEINFTMTGYPLTFFSLLAVSSLVSALTTQTKKAEKLRRETEKEAVRANLLRAMSHDIRTPLTGIVGNTAAILENEDSIPPEQRRQLLRDVNEDAQWLIQMVENLLSITRISGEQVPIHKEHEALEEIVAAAVSKFEKRFRGKVSFEIRLPDEVLLVPMDATLVQQVLINLFENALFHGKSTTKITVFLERTEDLAAVTVQDNGEGIPPERLEKLFDGMLSEVSGSNFDKKRNMGIGLSVCQTIVKGHGGTIVAYNGPEGGACFRFTLRMEENNENQR